ncbi:MAG TPA: PilZ domain-containing protein [Polyangia bacterium]|nr:PilZ domain-containing protein [Polyangia bacterium]
MLELIKACYEVRALKGRQELGLPLQAADEAAIEILQRLFYYAEQAGGRRCARRHRTRVPCCFKLHATRMGDGVITDLSADGMFIETEHRPALGSVTTLRIRDASWAREYHFGCKVVRLTEHGMAVELIGIPVECRYAQTTPAADLALAA